MILFNILKTRWQLRRRIRLLTGTIRETSCPRPAAGEPSDQTAGDCFDKGLCGCHVRVALGKETDQ
ncbi:hypothetical protein P7F60_12145 [Rhizobium sp. YJ-22]|uniref:hypothetical protein n=1 Tax=Rhizobium sp. YJ-22 TaxID=3037556 RepID=UPI0024122F4D|nr:hypothetical protein [Rhizobium sp. YJ-22]MDG3577144.1 hypothetical protein [Rhizobium sp. YJ-22]